MKQRLRDLEARDNWIEARVDELMDDDEWKSVERDVWIYIDDGNESLDAHYLRRATELATREHAEIEAMILDAQIDNLELK